MKLLIVFALVVAGTSALHLPKVEIQSKQPVIKHDGRIVGGADADIRKFNYQVGLELLVQQGDKILLKGCGGSLIAHNWVLTAAHCTNGTFQVNVLMGSAELEETEIKFEIPRSDDTIIEHELYYAPASKSYAINDIALIRIPTVKYSKNIIPVHLAKPGSDEDVLVNKNAIASGWGDMGDNDTEVTSHLQWVTLRIISNAECTELFQNIYEGNICVATGDDKIMRSPCPGDSGGPLVLDGTNIQIGLTSYGDDRGCAQGFPAVFSRVSYFRDWIIANTGIQNL